LTEEEEKIVSLIGGNVVVQGDMTVPELGFGATSTMLDVNYAINYNLNYKFTVESQLTIAVNIKNIQSKFFILK